MGSTLDQKATPALISISNSSKHIIQIVELLEERNMTFSFCLNKTDVLVICGMTLLYQTLALRHDSKLSKEGQKLVNRVIGMLVKAKAPGAQDFKRISGMIVRVDDAGPPTPPHSSPDASSTMGSQRESPAAYRPETPQDQRGQSLGRSSGASASETDLLQQQAKLRRMTMPSGGVPRPEVHKPQGRRSFDNTAQGQLPPRQQRTSQQPSPQSHNIDYLSIAQHAARMHMQRQHNGSGMSPSQSQRLAQMYQASPAESKVTDFSPAQWEALLGSLDGGQANVYDAIYGGPSPLPLQEPQQPQQQQQQQQQPMPEATQVNGAWLEEPWDLAGFSLNEFDGAQGQGAMSMSEESVSPGDETAPADLGLGVNNLDLGDGLSRCGGGPYMNGLENEFIL